MSEELFSATMTALRGRVETNYAAERFRAAMRDGVTTADGANVSLRDSTGVTLSGPVASVASALAELYASTAPEDKRTQEARDDAQTGAWDRLRDEARARQAKANGTMSDAARAKLEAL